MRQEKYTKIHNNIQLFYGNEDESIPILPSIFANYIYVSNCELPEILTLKTEFRPLFSILHLYILLYLELFWHQFLMLLKLLSVLPLLHGPSGKFHLSGHLYFFQFLYCSRNRHVIRSAITFFYCCIISFRKRPPCSVSLT